MNLYKAIVKEAISHLAQIALLWAMVLLGAWIASQFFEEEIEEKKQENRRLVKNNAALQTKIWDLEKKEEGQSDV